MVLVDPRSLQATPSQIDDVLPDTVRRLDREIGKILDTPAENVREKVHKYNRVLDRYLTVYEDYQRTKNPSYLSRSALTTPSTPPDQQAARPPSSTSVPTGGLQGTLKEEVLTSLPPSLRSKGELMLAYVQKAPGLTFSENGQMVFDGVPVPNTHLVDLVHEAVRPSKGRPKKSKPEGLAEFYQALRRANAPTRAYGKSAKTPQASRFPQVEEPFSLPSGTPRSRTLHRSPPVQRSKRKKRGGTGGLRSPTSVSWSELD